MIHKLKQLLYIVCILSNELILHNLGNDKMRQYTYQEDYIYNLSLVSGFKTTLIFDKYENIENLILGSGSGINIIKNYKYQEIILEPLYIGINTNFIIITNKRKYWFTLKSYDNIASNEDKIIYSFSFKY